MADRVMVEFLRDTTHGGDAGQPKRVAELLANFVEGTKKSLDVAIYDFRLEGSLATTVVDAFAGLAESGTPVRIAYDASKPEAQTALVFAAAGADPAPVGTAEWLHEQFKDTKVELRPITTTSGNLMHDKYLVRDAHTRSASVWTGSSNFTVDAWTRQENNIVRLMSGPLTTAFASDFAEMWASGTIARTGAGDSGSTTIDRRRADWGFGPGDGQTIDAHLAGLISAARGDVAIASMVLTSATILGALTDAIDRGINVHGIVDSGQMGPIVSEWKNSKTGKGKAATFIAIAEHLHAKRSTRYTPTSVHDFMHNKVLVIDNQTVATGSHNFSHNAIGNAENSLTIHDTSLAAQYNSYIEDLESAYPVWRR